MQMQSPPSPQKPPPGKHANLATPAVRHLLKEHNLSIADIEGTGRDGRVLKDDIQRYVSSRQQQQPQQQAPPTPTPTPTAPSPQPLPTTRTPTPLTPIQRQMFKTMTHSLTIPHFLYTTTVDFTALTRTRHLLSSQSGGGTKLTPLPFILKALSLALHSHPLLNAHLDTTTTATPQLVHNPTHDIGLAVDSPTHGLLVPVIRNLHTLSIAEIAAEITRLADRARAGTLTSAEMSGATFTVSNVGAIGGGVVSPVIVPPQVGILGIGRARVVPAFGAGGEVVAREECVFSWSADHRVVDGAAAARCAEEVRGLVEGVEGMLVRLK